MTALIGTVFLASLLGSLHCAGMCGAFVAFAVGSPATPGGRAACAAGYHGGRLVTYALLGAIAGSLGAALDWGGSMLGLSRIAAVMAGAMMIGFGVVTLLRLRGVRLSVLRPPAGLARFVGAGQRFAMGFRPLPRATLIGLLTTLLPCGWLWAFAITAAGTGSAAWGAATMAVFWLGTLPVLVTLGLGVQKLSGALGPRLPAMTAVALVVVGLLTVIGRLGVDGRAMAAVGPAVEVHEGQVVDHSDQVHCPICETP